MKDVQSACAFGEPPKAAPPCALDTSVSHQPLRLIALTLTLAAALVAPPSSVAQPGTRPQPVGKTGAGGLEGGFEMPLRGHGYRFYGPVEARRSHYTTVELGALIGRVARTLQQVAPGPPLVVGDCSGPDGGRLRRHRSHQSGRDVDLLFFSQRATGQPTARPGFRAFDGAGRCVAAGCDERFDTRRNWWLVRTLLASRDPAVQFIFVSNALKKHLLAWAEAHGEHPEIMRRARRVLRQPGDSAPHDDHFHVRITCPPKDRAPRCVSAGPSWPWIDARGIAAPIR